MPGEHCIEIVNVPSIIPDEHVERLKRHFEEHRRKMAEEGVSPELQDRIAALEDRAFFEGTS